MNDFTLRPGDAPPLTLKRAIATWDACDPKAMATQSIAALAFAFEDARHDILALSQALADERARLAAQQPAQTSLGVLIVSDESLPSGVAALRDGWGREVGRMVGIGATPPTHVQVDAAPAGRVVVDMDDRHHAALLKLATEKDLTPARVMVQALRLYQSGAVAPAPFSMLAAPHDSAETRDAARRFDVCDGKEQQAFEAWAGAMGYDLTQHPLHYLFLDKRSYAAREGWREAIRYCVAALSATPTASPARTAPEAMADGPMPIRDYMLKVGRAILALSAPTSPSADLVLVPREPTEAKGYEHDRAVMEGERNASLATWLHWSGRRHAPYDIERAYEAGFTNGWDRQRAMIEAAAAPESREMTGQERDAFNNALRASAKVVHPGKPAAVAPKGADPYGY